MIFALVFFLMDIMIIKKKKRNDGSANGRKLEKVRQTWRQRLRPYKTEINGDKDKQTSRQKSNRSSQTNSSRDRQQNKTDAAQDPRRRKSREGRGCVMSESRKEVPSCVGKVGRRAASRGQPAALKGM